MNFIVSSLSLSLSLSHLRHLAADGSAGFAENEP
jgi:hypothetical protein